MILAPLTAAAAVAAGQPQPAPTAPAPTSPGGWVGGQTLATDRPPAPPKSDMPDMGPPPLWVRADEALLARPITLRVVYSPKIGHHVVIPPHATPYFATRAVHEAVALRVAVWDQRFPVDEDEGLYPVVYTTVPAGWDPEGG